MKLKEIQDLIDFIAESELNEVNIETAEFKISVKKNPETVSYIPEIAPKAQIVPSQVIQETTNVPSQISSETAKNGNYVEIKSPMIGTFYESTNPDAEPFVKVGDEISAGQPVCIIEAMKLFNEIESELSGKIIKVLVENASPVEYDQPLFLVDPS